MDFVNLTSLDDDPKSDIKLSEVAALVSILVEIYQWEISAAPLLQFNALNQDQVAALSKNLFTDLCQGKTKP